LIPWRQLRGNKAHRENKMNTVDKIERLERDGGRYVNDPKTNTPILISSLDASEIDRIYALCYGE
jgi:hypothetical protein